MVADMVDPPKAKRLVVNTLFRNHEVVLLEIITYDKGLIKHTRYEAKAVSNVDIAICKLP